jgi:hypothetical protein
MYEAAKLEQLYCGIEECTRSLTRRQTTSEGIQKAKLRIDTRLKVAQRLKPKELGEKVDVNHGGQDGNPVNMNWSINFVKPER